MLTALSLSAMAASMASAGLVTVWIVLIAIVVGIFSAIAPLGPVTVLVIQRALEGDPVGALKIGVGRVPAEVMYCALATFGIVALLEQVPGARLAIEIVGTLVFLAVGIWLVVQRPKQPAIVDGPEDGADPREEPTRRQWGYATGFTISILNPTLILAWSAGVAIALSMAEFEPTQLHKLVFPLALGVGIALGYMILVGVLKRFGARLEQKFVRLAIQSMGVVFVVLSVWNGLALVGLS
ncbi:LysE family translocator [Enhygromyxa salina]|uniref:LysE type translocator n=1 Tax=Enhygromyxa salina TaxID=215803 RepID=A0A2S9XQR1_9BACT|nr:LysE family transporter [Enhygromyxa salina]PRP95202.1 LysE type translocator [Enhygromyxa salina]